MPVLCDNLDEVKDVRNSVDSLKYEKWHKGTIYGKQFIFYWSENSNPRIIFDYIFKSHAIDGF